MKSNDLQASVFKRTEMPQNGAWMKLWARYANFIMRRCQGNPQKESNFQWKLKVKSVFFPKMATEMRFSAPKVEI